MPISEDQPPTAEASVVGATGEAGQSQLGAEPPGSDRQLASPAGATEDAHLGEPSRVSQAQQAAPAAGGDVHPAILTPYSVNWVSNTTPSNVSPGVTTSTTISFTNTGTLIWSAGGPNPVRVGYHWRDLHGNVVVWDGVRTPLLIDTPPGGTAVLIPTLQAPTTPGGYLFQWDLVQEGITWFQAQGATPLIVNVEVLTPYGVLWETHNTPSAMARGSTAVVPMTLTNVGSMTWAAAGANPVRLSYHWLDSVGNVVVWNGVRTVLTADVPTGGMVSLNATLQAPSALATYTLQWDLVQEGITWFQGQGVTPPSVPVSIG